MRPTTMAIAAAAALAFATPAAADAYRDAASEVLANDSAFFDAMWGQKGSLWLTVSDDGSRRDGLGEYACLVLSFDTDVDPRAERVMVTILDVAAMAHGEFDVLARVPCY